MGKSQKQEPQQLGRDSHGQPLAGEALYSFVREFAGDTALLSFSCGKDSIALWLHIRDKFKVIPYYLYWVPGLKFIEKSLAYYEDFFGQHILRLPHPLFYKMLNDYLYQPPERIALIRALNFPSFTYADIDDIIARYSGLDNPFCAIGMRMKDNVDRRNLILQQGSVGFGSRRYFYPIWDWDVNQVARMINDSGVALPIDYQIFGRTIAAWDYQYLAPLKQHFPEDYERILEWFPLIDLELFRYERIGTWLKNRPSTSPK